MNSTVLLLGASGQLGSQVKQAAPAAIKLHAPDSAELDITSESELTALIKRLRPGLVINAAAYTQVDKAEVEAERAYAVNAVAVEMLARAMGEVGRIIHVSTDFVFDGMKRTPYVPRDRANPVNVYGESKRAGEQHLQAMKPSTSVVIRTSWLYSPGGNNFVRTMLRLMAGRDTLAVVNDQQGAPTSAASLARVIWAFAGKPDLAGIFHWTDKGQASWFEFAKEIHKQALGLGLLEKEVSIQAISTAQYPTPARRPAYSVLDCSSTRQALGIDNSPWQEGLAKVLQQIRAD